MKGLPLNIAEIKKEKFDAEEETGNQQRRRGKKGMWNPTFLCHVIMITGWYLAKLIHNKLLINQILTLWLYWKKVVDSSFSFNLFIKNIIVGKLIKVAIMPALSSFCRNLILKLLQHFVVFTMAEKSEKILYCFKSEIVYVFSFLL